ncbi:NUDIX domain-containing protein [Candidatus Kaiserbacteria bacterium]|nr:NUDIX domain-containing protein [Candidatus Kaiserbacteria bacterium]
MTEQSVGIIVLREAPAGVQVCLVEHAAGHWGLPKGHAEAGETREQTARRELSEETGIADIHIEPGTVFTEQYAFERDGERVKKEVVYLLGYTDTEAIAPVPAFSGEIPHVGWFSLPEAHERATFPETKSLIEAVEAYLLHRA